MKLDQFQQIQVSSIYRGLTRIDLKEIQRLYGSRALAMGFVEGHLKGINKVGNTFLKIVWIIFFST